MESKLLNRFSLFMLILTLTIPKDAWMSQIHFQTIDFHELAQRASAILVVKRTSHPPKKKSIPIRKSAKNYPAYDFMLHTYEVIRVLRGVDLKAGSLIEVYPPNFDSSLKMHREYVTIGKSRSPMFLQYQPQAYREGDDDFLLFLTSTDEGHWAYYCFDSREGLAFENQANENEQPNSVE